MLAAYLFIGIVTGQWTTSINATALTLLGIAGGTTLGSAAIDASKDTSEAETRSQTAAGQITSRVDVLKTEKNEVEKKLKDPDTPKTQIDQLSGRSVALQRQIEELGSAHNKACRTSENFFTDILTDANGVGFHRFQLLVLSLVLGIVFGYDVWRNLTMPDFDGGMLGLFGISSTAFLGLKVPEPTIPRQAPATGASPAAPP